MCTMTHFANQSTSRTNHAESLHPLMFQVDDLPCQVLALPRFQVVPAGKAFFHIRETSTGLVRGFRADHNEACALARSLSARN